MKHAISRIFMITVLAVWSVQLAASTLTEKDVQNVISLMGESDTFEQDIERLVPELAEQRAVREQEMQQKIMQAMMAGEGNPAAIAMADMETNLREDMAIIRNNAEANGKMTAMTRKHGFEDNDDWIGTMMRVVNAHMAVLSEQPNPEMDDMIAQMEAMPNMPKEQIEEMKAQVLQMQEAQKRYFSDVPAEDKRVVVQFMDELNQVMNVYDE